jgi:hypothetical protein
MFSSAKWVNLYQTASTYFTLKIEGEWSVETAINIYQAAQ